MRETSVRKQAIVRSALLLAAGSLFLISTAHARPGPMETANSAGPQTSAASGSSNVVVIGRRQASRAEVGQYVEAILDTTGNDRVARWADRVCINVEGVDENYQNYFVNQIAAVARDLNLRVASRRRCDPSIYVVFTNAPDQLLDRIERERPDFFGAIARSERERFAASRAPVRWLTLAQLRGASGETPFSFYVDPKSGGVERPVPGVRAAPSRIQTGTRMDLQSMFVVVDVTKVRGASNGSLAAYLAMVVFGNVRREHSDIALPSILNLFDRSRAEGPTTGGLTLWDQSYLRSLYSGNWNMPSAQRTSWIRASMTRDLHGGGRPADGRHGLAGEGLND